MSYKRKQFDKQRNPVAKHNQHKGGPHGPSSPSVERMKTSKLLKELEVEDRDIDRDEEEYWRIRNNEF